MPGRREFSLNEAKQIGDSLGVTWQEFDVEGFKKGLNVELEHGLRDHKTDVTHDDSILTGKIALAHLNEFPDYYVRLEKMEKEAKAYWGIEL